MYNYYRPFVAGVCENLRDIGHRLSEYANNKGSYKVQDIIEDTTEIFRAAFLLDMVLKDLDEKDELSSLPVLEADLVHFMEPDP